MRAFFKRISGLFWLAMLGVLPVAAQTIPDEAPEYTGSVFDELTETLLDGGLFFGVIIAMALVVTGFFLGRKWLARVG